MDLNDGLFCQNGRCGFTLKPSFMREALKRFDPETPHKRSGYRPLGLAIQVHRERRLPEGILVYCNHCFSVKVISGQQLPKVNIKEGSIVDPLVRVEIHGVPMDQAKQETRYIENNGTSSEKQTVNDGAATQNNTMIVSPFRVQPCVVRHAALHHPRPGARPGALRGGGL